jgi:hypothetical protein
MGTITIASTRGYDPTDLVVLGVALVIAAVVAWQLVARKRFGRDR